MKSIEILKSKGITEATRFHNYEYLYEMMKTCCDEYNGNFASSMLMVHCRARTITYLKNIAEQYIYDAGMRNVEMQISYAGIKAIIEEWERMKLARQWPLTTKGLTHQTIKKCLLIIWKTTPRDGSKEGKLRDEGLIKP